MTKKKLSIKIESLRELTPAETSTVAGGAAGDGAQVVADTDAAAGCADPADNMTCPTDNPCGGTDFCTEDTPTVKDCQQK